MYSPCDETPFHFPKIRFFLQKNNRLGMGHRRSFLSLKTNIG